MGTITVKANLPGAKKNEAVGYYGDVLIRQGDKFEISDAPLKRKVVKDGQDVEEDIPGTIAAFSDNKRKGFPPGWMEFVNPEDEAKYRKAKGEAVAAKPAAAPAAAPAPAKPGATGGKNVLG